MKALILLAHGSRQKKSNEEIERLVAALGPRLEAAYPIAAHAFAELTEPTLTMTVSEVIERGASDIIVVPYFLAEGRHVTEDVPKLVAEAQQQHPGISIQTTSHIGKDDYMIDLLAKLIAQEGGTA